MRNAKTLLAAAVSLVTGVIAGWLLHTHSASDAQPAADKENAVPVRLADTGEKASLRALRARIGELERMLAAREKSRPTETAMPTNAPERVAEGRPHRPPRFGDFRAHMEELRKSDPARYVQMTNRMAKFRARHLQHVQDRLDLLAAVDTRGMTSGQKKTHEDYQDLLLRREELMEKMHGENLTDQERHELGRECMEISRQLHTLGQEERTTLLTQTAKAVGLEGDTVGTLVETVNDVINVTQTHGGPPPPSANGGPGGPGGPK